MKCENFLVHTIYLAVFLLSTFSLQGQKTDKIFMKNGDYLTCEIKSMQFGKMKVSVNDMSSINIEWDAIDSLWSFHEFEIHLVDGQINDGTLEHEFYQMINGDLGNVTRLAQVGESFWKRLDGSIDLGMNFDKSSDIFRLSLNADLVHRRFRRETAIGLRNVITTEKEIGKETRNIDLDLGQNWFADNDISYRLLVGYDQNTELGLEGRILAGGGVGKDFLNDQSAWLFAGFGAVGNREWSTDESTFSQTNAELIGTFEFKKFSYDFPEIDLTSELIIYSSLTDWGRVRAEWDIKTKLEIIDDFFISLRGYLNFDSRPLDALAAKNDWGLSFTVGYTL